MEKNLPEKPYQDIEAFKKTEYFEKASSPESEKEITGKFEALFEKIKHVPIADRVLLMFAYFKDPETPKLKKIIIAAGLLYFVTPIDIIPDTIPVLGLLDDIGVLSMVASYMINELEEYRNKISPRNK